jgi:hypothetical protein
MSNANELVSVESIEINGITYNSGLDSIGVTAGDTVAIKVTFQALEDATDVRMEADLESDKTDVSAKTEKFVVENGYRYIKTLTLKVPSDLQDTVSNNLNLDMKVWNGDYSTELPTISLRLQRPLYKEDILAINTDQSAQAGETIPVDVVVKNTGYSKLNDVFITVEIPGLGVKKTSYVGDLVPTECADDDNQTCNENDKDTANERIYVQIPYGAKAGSYAIQATVKSDDAIMSSVEQIQVENEVGDSVIASTVKKVVAVGQDANFEILIVNPSNQLKVYKIVTESQGGLFSDTNTPLVAVPAGSSKQVIVTAIANSAGDYNFNVNVFSGDTLVKSVAFTSSAEGKTVASNVTVVLTVILAIVFIVLLVVLIVLLGRKPQRADELGESYY